MKIETSNIVIQIDKMSESLQIFPEKECIFFFFN